MTERTKGLVLAGLVAATALLTAGNAHADIVLAEGFETSPPANFNLYGSQAVRDCTTAHTGTCSLKIDPTSTSTRVGADYTPDIPLKSRMTIKLWFKASSTSGDLDSDFVVDLNAGGQVVLHLTEGVGSNTGVSLITTSGSHRNFDSWSSANTWYLFTLVIDAYADTVVAYGPNNASQTLSISASATSTTRIDANGIEWSSTSNTVHYDDITVDTCSLNLLGVCV